jgi:hypothetical protein
MTNPDGWKPKEKFTQMLLQLANLVFSVLRWYHEWFM